MRRIDLLALLVVALASCGAERAGAPRGPAPAAEVERTAATFEAVASAVIEAWNSGDVDAVRENTIYGERAEGRGAIGSFAESFFAWYPGAQWKLLLPFGDGRLHAPVAGGVFAITVSGPSGEQCEVHAAVLLKTSDDQIVHEALYYGTDSLISCGWAR